MWSSSWNCSSLRRESPVLAVLTPDFLCAASPVKEPTGNSAENRKETSPRGSHVLPPSRTSPQHMSRGQCDGSPPGKLGREDSHLHSTNILCGAMVPHNLVLTKIPLRRGNGRSVGSVSEDSPAGKMSREMCVGTQPDDLRSQTPSRARGMRGLER